MRRRPYLVWHQDSPGVRVTVWRRRRPSSPFSRVGESFLYGHHATYPKTINLLLTDWYDFA